MAELNERDLARVIAEHRYAERRIEKPVDEPAIEICLPLARAVLDHIEALGDTQCGLRCEGSTDSYGSKHTDQVVRAFLRGQGSNAELVKRTRVDTAWATAEPAGA